MAPDKSNRGPADTLRIKIHQEHEIAYWTKAIGCTRAELIAGVGAVGVMASAVRRYPGK